MTKIKRYIGLALSFFLTYTVSAQDQKLDLTQPAQQKDFLQYLRSTVSLLEDKNVKEMTKGVQFNKISDSTKQQLAYEMMKDTTYFKRLYAYFDFLKVLESKYHISKFSKEEWEEVARFGASHGIYFLSAMRKFNEKRIVLLISQIIFLKFLYQKLPILFPTLRLFKIRLKSFIVSF